MNVALANNVRAQLGSVTLFLVTVHDDDTDEPQPETTGKPFDARVLLDYFDEETDDEIIGEALGVGRSTVNKWRNGKSHMVGPYRADVLACRLGKHPALVWGRLWWTAD